MPFYQVMCTIPTVNNVNADYATNTFFFEADDLTALGLVFDELEAFYSGLVTFFSDQVRQNNHELKAYAMLDPEPRAPVLERTWSLPSAPSGNGLPPEVALCLSFQGDRMSGVPQARRRGRVYIPFPDAALTVAPGIPNSTAINTVMTVGDTLLDASDAAATWTWVVYSRVEPGYTVITNGWVDNAWDTQRRRGRVPTVRTVFP